MQEENHAGREKSSDLGTVLAMLRIAAGWTIDRLAKASGISRRGIAEYERGRVPGLNSVARLLRAQGYPFSALDEARFCLGHLASARRNRESSKKSRRRAAMRYDWRITNEGRAWEADEAPARWKLTPEKFEMFSGRLFGSDEERVMLLGLLLENVGADRAVQLGDPEVWRRAVSRLETPGTGA